MLSPGDTEETIFKLLFIGVNSPITVMFVDYLEGAVLSIYHNLRTDAIFLLLDNFSLSK